MPNRRFRRAATVGVAALLISAVGPTTSTQSTVAAPAVVPARHSTFVADALAVGHGALWLRVPSDVEVGATIKIVGHARVRRSGPDRARTLVVSVRRGGRWVPAATKRSDTSGKVAFSLPAGDVAGVRALRMQVAKTPGLPGAKRSFSISVRGAGAPLQPDGEPGDWTYFSGAGKPGRWDSCQPIQWGYDPSHEYPGAAADVQRALADIATHTGFTFQQVPFDTAQLAVSWSRAADQPLLRGSVAGIAAPAGWPATYHGVMEFDGGRVVLDYEESDELEPGYAENGTGTMAWGAVMHHEILHALGLGHAAGERQVMFPLLTQDNQEFGAGDLAGMAAIGASTDCFPAPGSDLWDN